MQLDATSNLPSFNQFLRFCGLASCNPSSPEVWLDVNILVCGSLDQLCWNAISWGQKPAMVFFHPSYGTEALGGQDFVESWCLATKPQNPFFIRWRDTFKDFRDTPGPLGGWIQWIQMLTDVDPKRPQQHVLCGGEVSQ